MSLTDGKSLGVLNDSVSCLPAGGVSAVSAEGPDGHFHRGVYPALVRLPCELGNPLQDRERRKIRILTAQTDSPTHGRPDGRRSHHGDAMLLLPVVVLHQLQGLEAVPSQPMPDVQTTLVPAAPRPIAC